LLRVGETAPNICNALLSLKTDITLHLDHVRGKEQRLHIAGMCYIKDREISCGIEKNGLLPCDAVLARYILWPCVCLSHVGVLSKRLNVSSHKLCPMIVQGL